MFLATTAMLLQFLAIPSHALPANVETTVPAVAAAASKAAPAQPEAKPADDSSATSETTAANFETLSAAAAPETSAIYMPLLLPQPDAFATPADPFSSSSSFLAVSHSTAAEEKERRWEHRQKRIWTALDIAQSSAATFDAWSTRRVITSGAGQEMNPMLRPFAGNDSLYAVIQVAPLALDYVGHRMMMSHHSVLRHTWWIPQAVGTAVSFAGGVNNVAVYAAR